MTEDIFARGKRIHELAILKTKSFVALQRGYSVEADFDRQITSRVLSADNDLSERCVFHMRYLCERLTVIGRRRTQGEIISQPDEAFSISIRRSIDPSDYFR